MADRGPEGAGAAARYRLLDVDLLLSADRPGIVDACDRFFGRFRVPDGGGDPVPVTVRTDPATGAVEARMPDGARHPLPLPVPPEWFLSLTDVALASSAVPSFHAGAVALDGEGAMLCASSGTGKTCLTLALARSGCGFLSDELAPVTDGGVIEAYPRAVGLREGTARLLGLPLPGEGDDPPGAFRRFVDPAGLPGTALAARARLSLVVFLVPPRGPEEEGVRFLELGFARIHDRIAAELGAIPGVLDVAPVPGRHYPTLRLRVAGGTQVTGAVEAAASRLGAPIATARWGSFAPPDFGSAPVVRDLSAAEALLAWRRHLLNPRALCPQGGEGKALFRLAGLAAGTRFVEMTVGSLEAMVSAVTTLLREAADGGA